MAKYMLAGLLLAGTLLVQVLMADGYAKSEQYLPRLRARSMLQSKNTEESLADPPESSVAKAKSPSMEADDEKEQAEAEAPESRKKGKHHSGDVAGGGVILGGLVTAIFVAVYCYIRVTRKRNGENR